MPDSVSDTRTTIQIVFTMVREAFLSRAALHLENLALRQQLAVVHRKSPRPSLCTADRPFRGKSATSSVGCPARIRCGALHEFMGSC